MRRVIIIGSGQIGSRHLQALKAVPLPLSITVIDASPESLKTAQERYESMPVGKFEHKMDYITEILKNSEPIDLAIIATCSDARARVTTELLESAKVKYLILEKILFNKRSDYEAIGKLLVKTKTKTWVNIPLRVMPTYTKAREYFKDQRISYIVTGSKIGLATNAIHYFDHVAFITGSTDYEINTSGLDPHPIKAKRKGFLEFTGTLTARFKNGSNVSLTSYPNGNSPIITEISSSNARYIGRESEGKAWLAKADSNWQWQEIEATIPPQSKITTLLTENILNKGTCNLVEYKESKKIHLQMLEPLRSFLNKNSKKKYSSYPFT